MANIDRIHFQIHFHQQCFDLNFTEISSQGFNWQFMPWIGIKVKWMWYNGCDEYFHIMSGRINMWKGVNQLKELFFLNLFIFDIYLKLTNHRYFMIKNPLFFTIHNRNGLCCKILSLNDLTPESDQSTGNPLFIMTMSQRACKPVMMTQAFSLQNQHRAKALRPKSGGRKKVLVMLGYHSIQQML